MVHPRNVAAEQSGCVVQYSVYTCLCLPLLQVRGHTIMRMWRALHFMGWADLAQADRVAKVCTCFLAWCVYVRVCPCARVCASV